MARTRGGSTVQPHRSSRIKQSSQPRKKVSPEFINLANSTDQQNNMEKDATQEETQEEVPTQEVPTQENEQDNEQAPAEQGEPTKKIKITKWKRKTVEQETKGAIHFNKAKDEMKIRNSPRLFNEMVYYLSEEQKKWIFDHNTVSLRLKNKEVPITEEDVYDVFGMPFGGESIMLEPVEKCKLRTNEWLQQFPVGKQDQVTTAMVVQIMRGQGLTLDFKRNFLIVMSNVLCGTGTYSYVAKQLLRLPGDLDDFYKYNWIEYLINYLVSATEAWNRTSSTFFSGSLVSLMLFYVDRVRHKGINLVERQFSSYKCWSEEKLKQRQAIEIFDGVFGYDSLKGAFEAITKNTKPKKGWNSWTTEKNQPDLDIWQQDYNHCNEDTEVPNVHEEDVQQMQDEPDTQGENQDKVQLLEERAHDLIESKLLFDTDLQLELKNDPQNCHLLTIRDIINDVFHPRKENEPNMGTNQESCQQDQQEPPTDEPAYDGDFELRPEKLSQIDLMEYV
ncbi:hypothetical protein POM88_026660 [Heracleum sosnowskyi]|uniref:Uncharacterized protein n=1 Tax=Heracleum sosnowskyi TaxID=360622 RepID=A0AAD8I7H8_9APIA|nr:hypothetical protein POM88_026660 [Heracleum sosnowskyi]